MDSAVYYTWETKAFDSYAELKNKYSLVVKKINDIQKVQEPKVSRKEALIDMKSNNTISQTDDLELTLLDAEEHADTIRDNGIKSIKNKYDSQRAEALNAYNSYIAAALTKYNTSIASMDKQESETIEFYNSQHNTMIKKANRIFESKKRMAERRVETLTKEKIFLENNKTTSQMTATREKEELLKNMNTIIQSIASSRKQYADAGAKLENLRMLPTLPEELATLTHPLTLPIFPRRNPCPCGSFCPKNLEFDMPQCMVDEEASSLSALAQAKQQAIEEDRKLRREIERKEALAAEERLRLLQEYKKKEEEKELEAPSYESDEESEDEDEIECQIEEAKEKQRIYLENRNSILKRVIEFKDTIDKKPIRRIVKN